MKLQIYNLQLYLKNISTQVFSCLFCKFFLNSFFAEHLQATASFGESPKTMRKLCLSTKFLHQEIRWNYGILSSVYVLPNSFEMFILLI